ncbi:MAG TPA: sortase [Anaerolineae bacterium]|nr:sortase [Anaerolineae bacterium]
MNKHCPYLGLLENPEQVASTAHPHHRCYVARQPERIGSTFQASTCLSSGYLRCPRLATRAPAARAQPHTRPSTPVPAASPTQVRYTELKPAGRARHRHSKAFEFLIVSLVLSSVAAALALGYAMYDRLQAGTGVRAALVPFEPAPAEPTWLPTIRPTAPLAETATPTPTVTPAARVPSFPTPQFLLPPAPATPAPCPPAVSPPTRLVIEKISVDIPVKPVGPKEVREGNITRIVWDDLPNAGAFHNTSAYPGNSGNIVINGPRDIQGAVFAHLNRVEVGDEVVVYVGEVAYSYQVTEVLIVPETFATAAQRAENVKLIGAYPEERLTLVTCTPVGLATHRLVVIARPSQVLSPEMPLAGDDP